MGEIIKKENGDYKKYEDLIQKRDDLRKKSEHIKLSFMQVFGKLILDSFGLKIECIKLKKSIEFIQQKINHGEIVDEGELFKYLKNVMADYENRMNDMIKDYEKVQNASSLTKSEILELKRIYHRLAKRMHPDRHPELSDNERINELWNRVVIVYNANDLEALQELEIVANLILEEEKISSGEIKIPDIDERIEKLEKEIADIIKTKPYTYIYILDDEEETSKKKKEYKDEIAEYERYKNELNAVLDGMINGDGSKWLMN